MSEVSSHPKGLLLASYRILVRGHKEPRAPPEAKMHGQEISTRQVELDWGNPSRLCHPKQPGGRSRTPGEAPLQVAIPPTWETQELHHLQIEPPSLTFFSFQFYLRYNWHTSLCKFKIYDLPSMHHEIMTTLLVLIAKLSLTFRDPVDYSTPGFLVLHHLP